MKTSEIQIRDPFILVHNGKYYLYGSGRRNGSKKCGFDVVTSTDLENWSEPKTIFEQNDNIAKKWRYFFCSATLRPFRRRRRGDNRTEGLPLYTAETAGKESHP